MPVLRLIAGKVDCRLNIPVQERAVINLSVTFGFVMIAVACDSSLVPIRASLSPPSRRTWIEKKLVKRSGDECTANSHSDRKSWAEPINLNSLIHSASDLYSNWNAFESKRLLVHRPCILDDRRWLIPNRFQKLFMFLRRFASGFQLKKALLLKTGFFPTLERSLRHSNYAKHFSSCLPFD